MKRMFVLFASLINIRQPLYCKRTHVEQDPDGNVGKSFGIFKSGMARR
jgi:hypothetical protein